jgi:hypothetical protein
MAGNIDAEIAALQKKLRDQSNASPVNMQAEDDIRAQLTALQKQKGQQAAGDMYSGTNNDAAMRSGEDAREALSGMGQAQAQASKPRPADFPIAFFPQLKAMVGPDATQDEVYDFWEQNKDNIQLNPSGQKFKDTKVKTIPAGVNRL